MSKTDDSFSSKDVSISLTSRVGFKRNRSFQTNDQNSPPEKRMKDFVDEDELRDTLLEELPSNMSTRDSESAGVNHCDENQQTRKIIKGIIYINFIYLH